MQLARDQERRSISHLPDVPSDPDRCDLAQNPENQQALGPDGIARSPQLEQRLNEAVFHSLKSEAGQLFMDYLRSITTNQVTGPEVSNDHLRHLEGQRFLTGVIIKRYELGKERAKNG